MNTVRSIFQRGLITLFIGCVFVWALIASEQHFWDKQDPSTWTPQQVTQLTSASPWAKVVTAVLISNDSNMAATQSRGGGGRRGGSYSTRENSGLPSPGALPKLQAVVQWVSAKPLQQVLKVHLPPNFAGHYVIGVSGLPLSGNNTEISEDTTLQVKRGESVHPEAVFQDPGDTSAIYFGFLPSMIDVQGNKNIVFSMTASPYEIKVRFNSGEMKYRGDPAL